MPRSVHQDSPSFTGLHWAGSAVRFRLFLKFGLRLGQTVPRRLPSRQKRRSAMSIHTATKNANAMPVRRAAPPAWRAGPLGLAALALLGGAVASQPAEAAPKLCGKRDQILKRLEQA